MSSEQAVIVFTSVLYLLILLGIGEYARRKTDRSREDYFLASRRFRTVAFFFGLLATFLTSFAVIGVPGMVYEAGIGVFGFTYGFTSLLAPLLIATVGYRIWIAGKRFGHITPAQIIDHRYGTGYLGLLLTALMVFWTLPYLLIGVMGGGIALETLTNGLVPYAAGGAVVAFVVMLYVISGGMRGATWTNIFQGAVFIGLLVAIFAYLTAEFGGFVEATGAVTSANPGLLTRSGPPMFDTGNWFSFALLSGMALIMFPQMFIRFFTASSHDTFRKTVVLFPVGFLVVGATSALLGFWGAGQIPGLTGQAVDRIFPMMLVENLPLALVGLGLVVILAAIMSSLDAQTLTISTMASDDVLKRYTSMSESREVLATRAVIAVLLLAVYAVSLLRLETVFDIGVFAFQGYALLLYPFAIGLYWKRATSGGVWAGLLTGFIALWAFQLGLIPSGWTFGFMSFVPAFALQVAATHAVSLLGSPPSSDRIEAYFEAFEGVW